jgi:hypothetical protein
VKSHDYGGKIKIKIQLAKFSQKKTAIAKKKKKKRKKSKNNPSPSPPHTPCHGLTDYSRCRACVLRGLSSFSFRFSFLSCRIRLLL